MLADAFGYRELILVAKHVSGVQEVEGHFRLAEFASRRAGGVCERSEQGAGLAFPVQSLCE